MEQGMRGELLACLADAVESVTVPHPTRVAVDGPPAAGKTTLADELAVVLRARGREVVRATIEDFLFPRAQRYRRGEYSPEGCWFDNHDYEALKRFLLDPLGPGGDRRIRHAVYDRDTDTALDPPLRTAAADAVLVFDGVFLQRPELVDRWELSVFVATGFEETVRRALVREQGTRSAADIERRWRERYIPSQQRDVREVRPAERADVLVRNDEPARPSWDRRTVR